MYIILSYACHASFVFVQRVNRRSSTGPESASRRALVAAEQRGSVDGSGGSTSGGGGGSGRRQIPIALINDCLALGAALFINRCLDAGDALILTVAQENPKTAEDTQTVRLQMHFKFLEELNK